MQREAPIETQHFASSSLAGTFGAVLTCPLEVIKTRYQSSQNDFARPRIPLDTSVTTAHIGGAKMKRPTILGSLQ